MTKPEGGKGPYSVEPFGDGQRYIKGPFPPGTVLVTVGLEEGTVISKMCNMAYAAGRASRDDLREALERSRMAIDDWLHSYAPEFCDEDRVAQTRSRISEKGTIVYIADVQKQNYETLSADEEAGK